MPCGGCRTSPVLYYSADYDISFAIIGPILVILKIEFCSCIRYRASTVLQTSLLLTKSLNKTEIPYFLIFNVLFVSKGNFFDVHSK